MVKPVETLSVYYENRAVGTIEGRNDGPWFVYDPIWLATRGAFPVSFLMPLSTRPVHPSVFLPWAANLLPEGAQLKALGTRIGASPGDVVRILSEIGRDTAGALSIGKPGTSSPGGWKVVRSEEDLERILHELPRKPFLVGDDGVSMSLAGVQSKIGVALDATGRIAIPHDGAPSTHILKPDSDRLFGSVQNEAMCLTLARLCGLSVPKVSTGRAGKRSYFLIERYDRIQQGTRWRRLHQEDFCQALGRPPESKYEANLTGLQGPSLPEMFALTRNAMGGPDVIALLDQAIFQVCVCNTDAHAKNYSMMVSGKGFSLAPIYDVMCAEVFDGVTRNLAQKIAGKSRGEHLKRRHWEAFGRECGLNSKLVGGRVAALAAKVQKQVGHARAAVEAMPAGPHSLLPAVEAAIRARARAILAGLEDMSGADKDGPAPPAAPKSKRLNDRQETRAASARAEATVDQRWTGKAQPTAAVTARAKRVRAKTVSRESSSS